MAQTPPLPLGSGCVRNCGKEKKESKKSQKKTKDTRKRRAEPDTSHQRTRCLYFKFNRAPRTGSGTRNPTRGRSARAPPEAPRPTGAINASIGLACPKAVLPNLYFRRPIWTPYGFSSSGLSQCQSFRTRTSYGMFIKRYAERPRRCAQAWPARVGDCSRIAGEACFPLCIP